MTLLIHIILKYIQGEVHDISWHRPSGEVIDL